MSKNAFVAVLESDLRTLSMEARKPEGFVGNLAGWLSNSEHPEVKEAAERAVLKLRAFAKLPNCVDSIRDSKEVLRPFQLACETKNSRLASMALGCIQKLLANDAVSYEGISLVVAVLQHVEKSNDEGVKLKMLQTALTLLQNPRAADNEEDVCQVLGLCFRMLANPKNTETVISTAAATVRQAVSVVFERAVPEDPTAMDGVVIAEEEDRRESHKHATSSGRTSAALHLLEDMCQLCSGSHAGWIQSPAIQRQFTLDLLDYVLCHNPDVFKQSAQFEECLRERVCHILYQLLSILVHAEGELGKPNEGKAVFKTVGTVLSNFYAIIPTKFSLFLKLLLKGSNASGPLWRRMCCLQVLRQLCLDPDLLYYMFVTFDMKLDYDLNAWHEIIAKAESIIQRFLDLSGDDGEGSGMVALTALFKLRSTQTAWGGDEGIGSGEVVLAMLALDIMLKVVKAIQSLTESLVEEDQADVSSPKIAVDGTLIVQRHVCVLMVDDSWQMLLRSFQAVLGRGCGEYLVLQLLKGFQSMLQASAALHVAPALSSFLTGLCEFSLPSNTEEATGPNMAILTPMNMHAFRTLFNVAHQLGNSLGAAWFLVVDTFQTLDHLLLSPTTTTREAGRDALPGQPSELAVLATAVTKLFESSSMLSTEAVVSLLSALRDASCQALPTSLSGTRSVRLFALARMVDVLLHNLHRIHDLWGIFLTHIIEIVNSTSSVVRSQAIDALDRAVTGALGDHRFESNGKEEDGAEQDEVGQRSPIMDTAVENMLLVALESLYRDVSDRDAQKGILKISLHAMQRHGESLSRGWVPILRLLESVPMSGDAELISTGFESVGLLINDYITTVPKDLQQKCLEVAAVYGTQTAAVNVSLSTISLLWTVTDAFGNSELTTPPPGSPMPDSARSRPGRAVVVHDGRGVVSDMDLMMLSFKILQGLSLDKRPEVRNSGIRTFFAVVVSHGGRLSLDLWSRCLSELILPLLKSVYHISVTSSSEESEAVELGKEHGKSVKMIVHHSRNSERKQWDETLVLALNGLSKKLRGHLPVLTKLEGFMDAWTEMMEITENAIAKGSKEVASSGIGLVTMVAQAHAGSGVLSPPMLQLMFGAFGKGVDSMSVEDSMTPTAAKIEMVHAVGLIYASMKERLGVADMDMLMGWMGQFARFPFDKRDQTTQLPGCLPGVQRATLETIEEFLPLENVDFWPIVMNTLCSFLQPVGISVSIPLQIPYVGDIDAADGALSPLWMEKVVAVVVKIYKDQAPWRIRAALFRPVIASLTRCMVTRCSAFDESLWKTASKAFNTVMNTGLPAINIAYVNGEHVGDSPWETLALCFEAFLLGEGLRHDSTNASKLNGQPNMEELSPRSRVTASQADTEARMTVLDTLTDVVLMSCEHAPEDIRERLIRVVDTGASQQVEMDGEVASGGRFSHGCLRKLYVLCTRGGEAQDAHGCLLSVSRLALPRFITRCIAILRKFAHDDLQCGTVRLPQARINEVVFTLDVLSSLSVAPSVIDTMLKSTPDLKYLVLASRQRRSKTPSLLSPVGRHSRSVSDGAIVFNKGSTGEEKERTHLLFMYGALCECVGSKEHKIRMMIRDLLQVIGQDVGLCGIGMGMGEESIN